MLRLFQFGGRRPLSAGHFLCLLLALTFLYNPFLGATSPVEYPSISHPPSFRATVASSELLKFKSKEDGEVQVFHSDEVVLLSRATAPHVDNFESLEIEDGPFFNRVLSVGNLWFRPPPVA